MFSFFKKKRSRTDEPGGRPDYEPQIPSFDDFPDDLTRGRIDPPAFDFSAPVPQGWGMLINIPIFEWEKATPLESFDQLRCTLEAHTFGDGTLYIVNTAKMPSGEKAMFKGRMDGSLPWKAVVHRRPSGEWEVAIDDNERRMLRFGEPAMGSSESPLVGTENAMLILSTFVKDGGRIPQLPHLLTSRPAPGGGYSFAP